MKTTLEQWQALQAVVEEGGFAQAAIRLFRSQSSISYQIARLQEQLGVTLLEPSGRKMVLTAAGKSLLNDAKSLLQACGKLEDKAHSLSRGWESEVRLAVDSLFPLPPLLQALSSFASHCPNTRLQMHEVVMSGADDALFEGKVDLAIAGRVPPGFLGNWLLDAEFIACAAPFHPLHQLNRTIGPEDLQQHTQVVVRDSGSRQPRDEGWLGASQRWTVTHAGTALAMVEQGQAFAWLASHLVKPSLQAGRLLPLGLTQGQVRKASLYLIVADSAMAGPATEWLAESLQTQSHAWALSQPRISPTAL